MAATSTSSKISSPEYNSWLPSYDELPMEIILQIFRCLGHSDLQTAGATCTRWREALMSSEFNNKTVVHFLKTSLSDTTSPGQDVLKCERPLRNFYLDEVTFEMVDKTMAHIGRYATEVTFASIEIRDKKLYSLIRQLPHLTSLAIISCPNLFMAGSFLINSEDRALVDEILANVNHFSLKCNSYLSDAILLRFTAPMQRLVTLDMSGCHIAFHNAIQKRFYPNDTKVPSENVLTFKFVLHVITLHQANLRNLYLNQTLMNAQSVTELAQLSNGGLNLQRLRLANCRQLNITSVVALIRTQSNLLHLDLSDTNCVDDDCIRAIVQHTPLLEVLRIAGCGAITDEGSVLLRHLKHLRHLDISRCVGIRSRGILDGIAATYNESMRELHMACLQVCEDCIAMISRNLPELRVLDVGHCVNGVTDESVQFIIQNLRWLRELSLEDCFRITDVAITGKNVSICGIKESSPASLGSFHPPLVSSIAERESLCGSLQSMKISLRSKAEEEIVRDASRKKAMLAAYESYLVEDSDTESYNIQDLRGLKILNLRGTKISDVSLKYGIKLLELRSLSLSYCQQISHIGMETLVNHCPSIEELDLSECYNINDRAIRAITNKLSRLRILHISGCTQLTDHSLDAILVNCKCLKTLSVYRCRRMYTDIEDRLSVLKTLRNLNMDNCTPIDNGDIFRFKKRLDY